MPTAGAPTGRATIYLDHSAATPLCLEAAEAMAAAIRDLHGNPSSIHGDGRRARAAVEQARSAAAEFAGADPSEIFFTSGATESNATLIGGIALHRSAARRQAGSSPGAVVTTTIEHPSVLAAAAHLAEAGLEWRRLPVDDRGELRMDVLPQLLGADTVLLSVAAANHELGNLTPLERLAELAHAHGALFHTDAAQAAGRVPLAMRRQGIDAATFSGHKMHGPAGTGMAFLRRGVGCVPLLRGGGQEGGLRAGTENLPGVVGLGVACTLAGRLLAAQPRIRELRLDLERRLLALPGARLHGAAHDRLAGALNLGFLGVPAHLAVAALDLDGVAASAGAACSAGTVAPSPVLQALGLERERAAEGIRFSLGPETSSADVLRVAALTAEIVERIRATGAR